MTRLAATLLCVSVIAALANAGAADDAARGPHEVRIPHADGSGRATIVEVHPSVSGAERFVRSTPEPIPRPGEIIVPTASPVAASSPTPPRRY